jgi:hypothetical protein
VLLSVFCLICVYRTSTGYIAIHDDSVEGPLLGYLNSHKIVSNIKDAVEYTYTTNGFMTEITVAVSLFSRFQQVVHLSKPAGLRIRIYECVSRLGCMDEILDWD